MFPTIGKFDKAYGQIIVTRKRLIKLSNLELAIGDELNHHRVKRMIVRNVQKRSSIYLKTLSSKLPLKTIRDYVMSSILKKIPMLKKLEEYYIIPSVMKEIIHYAKSKEKKYKRYIGLEPDGDINLEPDWDIKNE